MRSKYFGDGSRVTGKLTQSLVQSTPPTAPVSSESAVVLVPRSDTIDGSRPESTASCKRKSFPEMKIKIKEEMSDDGSPASSNMFAKFRCPVSNKKPKLMPTITSAARPPQTTLHNSHRHGNSNQFLPTLVRSNQQSESAQSTKSSPAAGKRSRSFGPVTTITSPVPTIASAARPPQTTQLSSHRHGNSNQNLPTLARSNQQSESPQSTKSSPAAGTRSRSFGPLTKITSPESMSSSNMIPYHHTLILGTHPSIKSHERLQYYGNPMK